MERKKRVVFAPEERMMFTELLEAYKSVIENKKCDSSTISEKNKAWEELAQRMNYLGRNRYPSRTVAQLKKLWDNTKYKWKLQANGGNREPARSDEENSVNYDTPNNPEMDSVGFQDMTEAIDNRLNIYQVPEVKSEGRSTWEIERNDHPGLQEDEPEPEHYRREHDHLYNMKLKEAQMKVTLLENQMKQDEELFQLKKRKLLLEILRLEKEVNK